MGFNKGSDPNSGRQDESVKKKNNNKNAQQWENLMINKSYQKSTVNKKHLQNDNLQKFEKK